MSTYTTNLREAPLRRNVTVNDGDGHFDKLTFQLNSTAIDFTSATFTLTVSDHVGGTSQVSASTVSDTTGDSGIVVDDVDAGQISVWIAPAAIATIGAARSYYEVQVAFPDDHSELPGLTKTLIAGELHITEDAIG